MVLGIDEDGELPLMRESGFFTKSALQRTSYYSSFSSSSSVVAITPCHLARRGTEEDQHWLSSTKAEEEEEDEAMSDSLVWASSLHNRKPPSRQCEKVGGGQINGCCGRFSRRRDERSRANDPNTAMAVFEKNTSKGSSFSSFSLNDGSNNGTVEVMDQINLLNTAIMDKANVGGVFGRSLSQKFRPRRFDEMVGQRLVVNSLSNAASRGRIAPVYLFHGPRGTGKTSAARIFAAAINCSSATPHFQRPCDLCQGCLRISSSIKEVDATSHNEIHQLKSLLELTSSSSSHPPHEYKVFVIDECHMLTTETWNALLKVLEEPPSHVVFILITTAPPGLLPRTATSRCQKFIFPKIKAPDMVERLCRLASLENIDVSVQVLELIAARSDGSLRDAETMLDQLSLLDCKISLSLVHELVGSVSGEELFQLLNLALSADTINTVRQARELVRAGIDPLSLMSQLATLITDILAGHTPSMQGISAETLLLEKEEQKRLQFALGVLSDAEKQLRTSHSNRVTWLIAALLQLCPGQIIETRPKPLPVSFTFSSNNGKQTANTTLKEHELDGIWKRALSECTSLHLWQLLHAHGKLQSISVSEGCAILGLGFQYPEHKSKAENSHSVIASLFEGVLNLPLRLDIRLTSSPPDVSDAIFPPAFGNSTRKEAQVIYTEVKRPNSDTAKTSCKESDGEIHSESQEADLIYPTYYELDHSGYDLNDENPLALESKYEGLLCWKASSSSDEEKVQKTRKSGGLFNFLAPCLRKKDD